MSWLRRNWIAAVSLTCAASAAGYGYLRVAAAMPADGGTIVYALTLIYNYSALPASIVVVLGAATALFFWLPLAMVQAPGSGRGGLWVGLAVAAAAAAIWAALPLGTLIYREVPGGTVLVGGTTYHLGLRVSPDPAQNAYVLCECPGLACACRYLFDESLTDLDPLPTLGVDAATQIVRVRVADRLLYEGPR
jgi:hypothetical protein